MQLKKKRKGTSLTYLNGQLIDISPIEETVLMESKFKRILKLKWYFLYLIWTIVVAILCFWDKSYVCAIINSFWAGFFTNVVFEKITNILILDTE